MLGKLLKYELRATARSFFPLYAAIFIVSFVNNILIGTTFYSAIIVGFLVLFGLFVAVGVLTVAILIQRFYSNLLGREGYLMFTLPASVHHLIISKLIVAVLWILCGGFVGICSGGILLMRDPDFMRALRDPGLGLFFADMEEIIGFFSSMNPSGFMALFLLTALLTVLAFVLNIYASISVGQLPIFQKCRISAAFVSFFLVNTITSSVLTPLLSYLINRNSAAESGLLLTLAVSSIEIALLYYITQYILKTHLNLE